MAEKDAWFEDARVDASEGEEKRHDERISEKKAVEWDCGLFPTLVRCESSPLTTGPKY